MSMIYQVDSKPYYRGVVVSETARKRRHPEPTPTRESRDGEIVISRGLTMFGILSQHLFPRVSCLFGNWLTSLSDLAPYLLTWPTIHHAMFDADHEAQAHDSHEDPDLSPTQSSYRSTPHSR